MAQIDAALEHAENPAEVYLERARAHVDLKDLTAALDDLNLAVTLDPELAPAWLLLGTCLSRLDRDTEAIEAFEMARDRLEGKSRAESLFGLANSLNAVERRTEALVAVEACLALDDTDWRPWALKGNIHYYFEDESLAREAYSRAVELSPDTVDSLQLQLGSLNQNAGRFQEAQTLFESVLDRNPQDAKARWYLAQCDLVQGHWERGWRGYAARFPAGASPYRSLPFPVWDGRQAAEETLLILADQGLGDEIMFASCVPDAMARVGHCIVECEPRLQALFRRSFPDCTVMPTQRDPQALWLREVPTPDWQIFGGDLPALFRKNSTAFGKGNSYLKADPERVQFWQQHLKRDGGAALKVGVSWRGGTPLTRARSRTLAPEDLAPVLRLPDCHFVNLQYGDCAKEIATFESQLGCRIHHHPQALADYDETAALVMAVDVVVTVCTSLVHLAGALGQATWVLVPAAPGWRYTLGWDRLPWYGSSRTYRQTSPGDWTEPSAKVSEDLRILTKSVS